MRRFRLVVGIVAGVGLLTMAMPAAVQAADKFAEVLIVNDVTRPVPAKLVGTTDVAGTVRVSGGSITVDNGDGNAVPTRSIGTSNVTVTNAPGEAIPVTVTNQAAAAGQRLPYQAVVRLDFGWNGSADQFAGGSSGDTIPEDKLLVIEQVAGQWDWDGEIDQLSISEVCDFTDGKTGHGGTAGLPVGAKGYAQPVGGATTLQITPGACYSLNAHVSAPTTRSLLVTVTGWLQDAPA